MKIDKFWELKWISLTLIGFTISLLILEIGERSELTLRDGLIGGIIIGIAQSIMFVKESFIKASLWLSWNIIIWGIMGGSGIGVIGWVAPQTNLLSLRLIEGALLGVICGFSLSLGQWLILRTEMIDAWRWLLISPCCWGIGLSLGWTMGGMLRSLTNFFLGEVIGLAITWIIVATTTGIALKQLLKHSLRPKLLQI
jgi:hypothetical protein